MAIRIEVVNLSLQLLDGVEGVPFRAVFVEGPAFVGKGNIYAGVILQPCSIEIDSVLDVRRFLDEIVETASGLAKEKMSEGSAEISGHDHSGVPDLFHLQDVWDRHVRQHLLEEFRRKPFSELRDTGGTHDSTKFLERKDCRELARCPTRGRQEISTATRILIGARSCWHRVSHCHRLPRPIYLGYRLSSLHVSSRHVLLPRPSTRPRRRGPRMRSRPCSFT